MGIASLAIYGIGTMLALKTLKAKKAVAGISDEKQKLINIVERNKKAVVHFTNKLAKQNIAINKAEAIHAKKPSKSLSDTIDKSIAWYNRWEAALNKAKAKVNKYSAILKRKYKVTV